MFTDRAKPKAGAIKTPPGADRRDHAVRSIVRAWRRLTTPETKTRAGPGARTLVACSGGADSSALVLALCAVAPGKVVVGHVVHDLRPATEAEADRDAVRALCVRLGVPFVEARVRPGQAAAQQGNAEGEARRMRYAALAELANQNGCGFVATAHHAGDQLETVLMRVLRGAGPAGLGGVAARRRLGRGVVLVRPMLGVTPADARRVCAQVGWTPREDATNADLSRFRNRLRAKVVPALVEAVPDALARAGAFAEAMVPFAAMVRREAAVLLEGAAVDVGIRVVFDRAALRRASGAVAGDAMRGAYLRLTGGRGGDRVGARHVREAMRLVNGAGRGEVAWAGARVRVERGTVIVEITGMG
jgi:tRNA(Ile)-lysidine synthase